MSGYWQVYGSTWVVEEHRHFSVKLFHSSNSILRSLEITHNIHSIPKATLFCSPIGNASASFSYITSRFNGERSVDNFVMPLANQKDVDQLKLLLATIQEEFPLQEETSVLVEKIQEFVDLFILNKTNEGDITQHFTFVNKSSSFCVAHVDPNRSTSTELPLLLARAPECPSVLESAKNLLRKGENPNAGLGYNQLTAGHYAMLLDDENQIIKIVNSLLQYGIDLQRRPSGQSVCRNDSILEYAVFHNKQKVLTHIYLLATHSIRSLHDKYEGVYLHSNQSLALTLFRRKNNKKFTTLFSEVNALSQQELDECFELYNESYQPKNKNEDIKDLFKKDFLGANKFIDRVYIDGKLVGFNVFELFNGISKKFNNHILVHHYHCILKKGYQSAGVMNYLYFRLAFALKKLHPKKTIVTFYSALSYNSVKISNNFLKGPKYQPEGYKEFLIAVLHRVLGHTANLILRGSVCSIEDNLILKNGSGRSHLKNNLFYNLYLEMSGYDHNRSVPELFFANDINLGMMQNDALQANLDFAEHSENYAEMIKPLMKKIFPEKEEYSHIETEANNYWQLAPIRSNI